MKQFTSGNLDGIRKDLNSVLEVAAEQLGISLTLGSFRYSAGEFNIKLTGICSDKDGKMVDPAEKTYNDYKNKNMLNLGDTFILRGTIYTICGWKPRAPKYPLLAKNPAGKTYKFSRIYAYKPGKKSTSFDFR